MALILPRTLPPAADGAAAELEATLARLPDEWTLLPRRHIGGEDGPEAGVVLLHPDIGAALVDFDPARTAAAMSALEALVARERLVRDGETLPVVGIALGAGEVAEVGARLAASFEEAERCDMRDAQWPDRLLDALLSAEDATMAPLRPPPRSEREPLPQPVLSAHTFRVEPEDAPFLHDEADAEDSAPFVRPRHTPSWAALTLGLVILAGGAGTAFLLANEAASPPPQAAVSQPLPVSPAASPEAQPDLAVKPAEPPAASLATAPPPEPVPLPEVASAPPPPVVIPAPEVAPQSPPPSQAAAPPPKVASVPPLPPAKDVEPAFAAPPETPPPAPRNAQAQPPKGPAAATAAVAKPKPTPAPRKSEKAVAELEPKAKIAGTEATSGAGPLSEGNGPPIDASQLPAYEGSDAPPPDLSASNTPSGPAVTPAFLGAPAPGAPVMLLPRASAPAAMPPVSNGPPLSGLDPGVR